MKTASVYRSHEDIVHGRPLEFDGTKLTARVGEHGELIVEGIETGGRRGAACFAAGHWAYVVTSKLHTDDHAELAPGAPA